jgi:hypothetical protein
VYSGPGLADLPLGLRLSEGLGRTAVHLYDMPWFECDLQARLYCFCALGIVVEDAEILTVLYRFLNDDPHSFNFLCLNVIFIFKRDAKNKFRNLSGL